MQQLKRPKQFLATFTKTGVKLKEQDSPLNQVIYGEDWVDVNIVNHWAKKCKDCELGKADLCD